MKILKPLRDLIDKVTKIAKRIDGLYVNSAKWINGSILDAALSCGTGITYITTGGSTTDLPYYGSYGYSSGLVLKRTSDQIWIILFDYNTGALAINTLLGTTWKGWKYIGGGTTP